MSGILQIQYPGLSQFKPYTTMKHPGYLLLSITICLSSLTGYAQNYTPEKQETRIAEPKIPIKAYTLPLKDVRLSNGPFKTAMEADKRWLLQLSPDRFLNRFHSNAGLPVKGAIYGGWESMGVSGHTMGHYMSACAMLYAVTGDEQIKQRVDYIVAELKRCQTARGTGYVGGIPNEDQLWDQVAKGDIRALGFDLNGLWVPWYTLHKLWAGLLDAYLYTDNEEAKEIVVKLTDWACDKFKNLSDTQWQTMLTCEIGGMNDVLMTVYAITGEQKHLDLANKFYHKKILDPLSQKMDQLSGEHANTQIPKVVGAARAYELTADEKYHTIASFFWETVTHDHSYVTGGNSDYEHFGNPGQLSGRLSSNTTETCNTYNMLKLTRHLFAWDPDVKYMDYYERALYNHILASQNPETGMVCYYVPLASNVQKFFSSPDNDFWCCVGSGLENHVKYAENIYSEDDNALYINLFVASELNWKRKGMQIKQETNFPDAHTSKIIVSCASPVQTTFLIRFPSWATEGYTIKVNGVNQALPESPGCYVSIDRTWSNQDIIEIALPFHQYKEVLLGDTHKHAFLTGPIVLAGEIPTAQRVPVFLNDGQTVNEWMKPLDGGGANVFRTTTGFPENIQMIPFYKKYQGTYAVYFDCFTPEEWEVVQEEYERELEYQRELESLTVDYFRPNEQQQEVDHNFKGSNVRRGEGAGRKWCDADNGWFSFEMKADASKPQDLSITYWGSDSGNRSFDIMVDDEVIATESLAAKKPNEFMDVKYDIPFYLTSGKTKVTVKLKSHAGNVAGGIFGSRILLKKPLKDAVVCDYLIAKQPYIDNHQLKKQPTGTSGVFYGRSWLDARGAKPSIVFEMACDPNKPTSIFFSFWGAEIDKRNFDILAEGEKIGTQELYKNNSGEFFDAVYTIPENLTQGKTKITIKLQAINNTTTVGGFWYAYTFRQADLSSISSPVGKEQLISVQARKSSIKVSNLSGEALSGQFSIYSISGVKVTDEIIKLRTGGSLDFNINPGLYFVNLISDNEKQIAKVIVH